MGRTSDVVIVGAGIVGCAVARELARRGLSVRVLEARAAAAGATQASAGMLAPYLEGHAGTAFLDLTARSLGLFDAFIEGVRSDTGHHLEYRRNGSLQVAFAEQAPLLRGAIAGDGPAVWVSPDALHEAEPWLAPEAAGAALVATHGYVGVEELTLALLESAARRGAVIESGVSVSSIVGSGGRLAARSADGREWPARWIVVAAGCWSGSLGLNDRMIQAVRPVRGQLLRLRVEGTPIAHVVWGPDCYVVPWTDGTVLVGATEEDAGFDQTATADGVRSLLNAAVRLFPRLASATFLEVRAGLRPASPDDMPIIGPSARHPGVVYATGHFRNGVLLAPLTAALVADAIGGRADDPALALTRPDRRSGAAHDGHSAGQLATGSDG